jgi:hypothetical protein
MLAKGIPSAPRPDRIVEMLERDHPSRALSARDGFLAREGRG